MLCEVFLPKKNLLWRAGHKLVGDLEDLGRPAIGEFTCLAITVAESSIDCHHLGHLAKVVKVVRGALILWRGLAPQDVVPCIVQENAVASAAERR